MPEVAFSLEDLVVATYCALDDALSKAGISARKGRLIPRPGPPPEVDDREILCLAILQELLGYESDNHYQNWLAANPIMRELFPRRLSRPNFADRRALLTPLMQRLCAAFCDIAGEAPPPFSPSTPTRSMCADSSAPARKSASGAWPERAIAPL